MYGSSQHSQDQLGTTRNEGPTLHRYLPILYLSLIRYDDPFSFIPECAARKGTIQSEKEEEKFQQMLQKHRYVHSDLVSTYLLNDASTPNECHSVLPDGCHSIFAKLVPTLEGVELHRTNLQP